MKIYICHICGFDGLNEEPYEDNGRIPSHNICDCCGCQFGYDDNERYRQNWIDAGGKWFNSDLKPKEWDIKEQLKKINVDV